MATCTNFNATNVTAAIDSPFGEPDLIVLHLGFGGRPGENTDLTSLELYSNQTVLLAMALATGKDIVLVLFTALPPNITGLVANPQIRAIIMAYYPQHHGGTAVVDVMTGKVNPAGRLVSTWPIAGYDPKLHGEIGNYSMIGTKKTYRFSFPSEATLFSFGYGRSYTDFSYSDMTVSPTTVAPCDTVNISVTVHNTGAVDGSEVVQLYLSWSGAGLGGSPTADLQLADFARVFVPAGGSAVVALAVDARHYAVLQEQPPGANGTWVPPAYVMKPVEVAVSVGGQQPGGVPRLSSNVLAGSFAVAGDGSPASRCPRWLPHDHRGPTKFALGVSSCTPFTPSAARRAGLRPRSSR